MPSALVCDRGIDMNSWQIEEIKHAIELLEKGEVAQAKEILIRLTKNEE